MEITCYLDGVDEMESIFRYYLNQQSIRKWLLLQAVEPNEA